MKNKYQRMNKNEKKELQKKFFETDNGKNFKSRTTRVLIYAVLLIIISFAYTISNFYKNANTFYYILDGIIFISGISLLIAREKIKIKVFNNYAIKNTSSKK